MQSVIEKIFESFPFRFLISVAIGGFVFALTPSDNATLLKFGTTWYIVFVALITFLILSFILWLFSMIKNIKKNKQNKKINQERILDNLERVRKEFFNMTDQWPYSDIKLLKKFIKNGNKAIKHLGGRARYDGIYDSNIMCSKEIISNEHKTNSPTYLMPTGKLYTLYWLDEDFYNRAKFIYDNYGKLSKFDKE